MSSTKKGKNNKNSLIVQQSHSTSSTTLSQTEQFIDKFKDYKQDKIQFDEIITFLDELEDIQVTIPKQTLKNKIHRYKISVYTTEILLYLLHSKIQGWQEINMMVTSKVCDPFECIMICAIYYPETLYQLTQNILILQQTLLEHEQEWYEEAKRQQTLIVETVISQLKEKQIERKKIKDQANKLAIMCKNMKISMKEMKEMLEEQMDE
jgi:hypothetical protein